MKPENFQITSIKAFLGRLAGLIRVMKQLRKMDHNQRLGQFPETLVAEARTVSASTSLYTLRHLARHYHVAYCEFKGKTRQQVENKSERLVDEKLIAEIKSAISKSQDEQAVLYVLVRKDLAKSSQAVQAGHAVAQFVLEHGTKWQNQTLIYLSVPNEGELVRVKDTLKNRAMSEFREPDLANALTAFAVLSNKNTRLLEFSSLPLV